MSTNKKKCGGSPEKVTVTFRSVTEKKLEYKVNPVNSINFKSARTIKSG